MKNLIFLIIFLVASVFSMQFMGCASSKPAETASTEEQDDYSEIEKLLGINRDEGSGNQDTSNQQNDDDLLKLLEADEGKAKARQGGNGEVEDKRLVALQNEVEKLKKQLREKNVQIADLKAQLMMKNEALKASDTQPTQYSTPASGSYSSADYEAKYNQAYQLYQNRQYREALRLFEELVAENTHNELADNAQYWIGECYYALGDYRAAILAFEKVFTFKQSNKNDYAQYKLGLCYFALGDKARARDEFQNLLDNYPQSNLINRAEEYLARL